jgi:hypothetical protein
MPDRIAAIRASALGAVVHLVFVASVLATHDFDPSWFVRFGVEAKQTQLGHQLLGSLITHSDVGADGQFFWVLARDPLLLHPQTTAAWLDRPVYRAQRVMYPALAAPWRLFGEKGVLWALLLENVLAVAIGSYFTARLAMALGLPARTALAFAFNPGVIFATMFDVCDALALALTVSALYAAVSRKYWPLIVLSALAGLAKEPSALALGAAAVIPASGQAREGRPPLDINFRALLAVPAVAAIVGWGIYVRVRFDWAPAGVTEFAPPFTGFITALNDHWANGLIIETIASAGILAASVAIVVLFARRRTFLLAAALPYALLIPVLGPGVMLFTNNALRAFAPAFTFLWLEIYRTPADFPPVLQGQPTAPGGETIGPSHALQSAVVRRTRAVSVMKPLKVE